MKEGQNAPIDNLEHLREHVLDEVAKINDALRRCDELPPYIKRIAWIKSHCGLTIQYLTVKNVSAIAGEPTEIIDFLRQNVDSYFKYLFVGTKQGVRTSNIKRRVKATKKVPEKDSSEQEMINHINNLLLKVKEAEVCVELEFVLIDFFKPYIQSESAEYINDVEIEDALKEDLELWIKGYKPGVQKAHDLLRDIKKALEIRFL